MSRNEWVLLGVGTACGVLALSNRVLPAPVWITALGVLAGGLITALFSWYFYRQASRELQSEAANLRRLNLQLVYLLDSAGVIHVSEYDETGEPVAWRASKRFDTLRRVKPSEAKEPLEPPSDEREAPETDEG